MCLASFLIRNCGGVQVAGIKGVAASVSAELFHYGCVLRLHGAHPVWWALIYVGTLHCRLLEPAQAVRQRLRPILVLTSESDLRAVQVAGIFFAIQRIVEQVRLASG